jgi:8-oxo-dGTP diphosphatase
LGNDPQSTKISADRYQFVVRTLVFIFHQDKVLLLKGAPDKRLWANRYNGIGGHVEQGESIPASALRELEEEVGLTDVVNMRLRGVITIDPNTHPGILLFLFTGNAARTAVRSSSEGVPEWIDWQHLPPESMVEDLPILLNRLAEMRETDPPFYAHYRYDNLGALSIQFAD